LHSKIILYICIKKPDMKKTLALLICILSFSSIVKSQGTFYMEYKMEMGKGKEGLNSNSKTWHSSAGTRIESEMTMPGMGPRKHVMLMLKNNPGVIFNIDDEKKSYTEIKSPNKSDEDSSFTVEILGKEKVGNYNCVHAKLKSKDVVMEVWTTKEIEYYKELQNSPFIKNQTKGMSKSMFSGELEGMMVKMKDASEKEAMTMELVKFEKGNFPQSMFEIPAGYSKGMSIDPSKMQSMTPEERQKMMEEIMKQYGKEEKE